MRTMAEDKDKIEDIDQFLEKKLREAYQEVMKERKQKGLKGGENEMAGR